MSGAPSSCSGAILSGNYIAGTGTTSSNSVLLQVHVDSIGPYTIITNTVNGFSFSGTGNFIDTGTQSIKLTASGKPIIADNTTFPVSVGLGCSFTVPVIGNTSSCTGFTLYGSYDSSLALLPSDSVVVQINVTAIGNYSISTDTVNGIHFSATGTFMQTGSQNITLMGTGTPTTSGSFTYTLKIGNTACSFVVPVNGSATTGYITGTFGGVAKNFNYNIQAAINTGIPKNIYVYGRITQSSGIFIINIALPAIGDIKAGNTYSTVSSNTTSEGVVKATFQDIPKFWRATVEDPTPIPIFSVTITKITSNNMQGTFSGIMRLVNGVNGTGAVYSDSTLTVTSGTFNVPI